MTSTWVVVEFVDVYGKTCRFRAWSPEQAAERFRHILWSYLGYPGMTYRIVPGLGYADCNEDGIYWAKSGEQALENQLQVPMTVRDHETWVGITGYYERHRLAGTDSGD